MLAFVLLVGGCGGPASRPAPPHGILLVSLDTLRADYLGVYGYTRFETSPNLDRLARESYVFDDAIVTEPWTLTSHMSLLTGLHPHQHRVVRTRALAPGIPTLAALLREHGYRTAAYVDGGWVDRQWGFDRGFETWVQGGIQGLRTLAPAAIRWLDANADEPFFLFLHTFDVHSLGREPWFAKSGGRGRFSSGSASDLEPKGRMSFARAFQERAAAPTPADVDYIRATYADGVRFVDEQLGRVLEHLRESGLDERTLIVVWSDHGEALFDHDARWSHDSLYLHTSRSPLLIRMPGLPGGRRIPALVSSVDLAPTILDLAGAGASAPRHGRSLVPLLLGRELDERPVFTQLRQNGARRYAVRSADHHLIWDVDAERWRFFDLRVDPLEQSDLHPSGSDEEERLRDALIAWVEEVEAALVAPASEGGPLDADTRDELRALGYLE